MDTAFLYHATPLHYVPRIVQDGALYAARVLAPSGILPRASAARRDRSLGLSDWVHLSLRPDTPLLADKVKKGYSHALLAFDREQVMAEPNVAFLPYNAKAWHTRAALSPITDIEEKSVLLSAYAQGRYPSLEVLVKYGLGLDALRTICFLTDNERQMFADLMIFLDIGCSALYETRSDWFGLPKVYLPSTQDAIIKYFNACREARNVLPPPAIPFD